jgi:hypothetical protein
MREVGVHDDDEVARCELQAVDVGGAEAELAGARAELDARGGVGFLELLGDFLRSVRGAVVNDYELPVDVAVARDEVNAGLYLKGGSWGWDLGGGDGRGRTFR